MAVTAFSVPALLARRDERVVRFDVARLGSQSLWAPIASALQHYKWHTGVYPDTREGLRALFERPSSVDESSGKWKGPYLVPADPEKLKDPWGNEYQYRYPGQVNEKEFDLWSYGPDGKDNTDDDITSWKKS